MNTKPAVLLLALLPALCAQPDRFSTPACTAPGRELARRASFLLCHSSAFKVPIWTAYELLPQQMDGSARRPSRFRADSLLTGSGASDSDYRGSGLSRGHMVPAEDLAFSDASIQESFLLSNVVPQLQEVNAGPWRRIENAVRRIAASAAAVYVFTGPIFDSADVEFIGAGRVAVPTHFFKVILALGPGPMSTKRMYAAIVPNADPLPQHMDEFAVPVEEVERRTGLDFFSGLDDSEERRLESIRQHFSGNR